LGLHPGFPLQALLDGNTGCWFVVISRIKPNGRITWSRAPTGTTFSTMVMVAGRRSRVEESLELGKGEVGLDQYEVRTFIGWYRHYMEWISSVGFLLLSPLLLFLAVGGGSLPVPVPQEARRNTAAASICRWMSCIPNNIHITLAMLALAYLVVVRSRLGTESEKGGSSTPLSCL